MLKEISETIRLVYPLLPLCSHFNTVVSFSSKILGASIGVQGEEEKMQRGDSGGFGIGLVRSQL